MIANGDELVLSGVSPRRDQIICSIPYALDPMIKTWGDAREFIGIARDSLEDLRRYVEKAHAFDLLFRLAAHQLANAISCVRLF
ncbi:MAG: hypothetical protein AAFW68_05525 [Pseudomonadota bacterium]